MKKILISLISLITLTACVSARYSYYPVSSYRSDKISISAGLVNAEDENSPVDYIWVSDKRGYVGNSHYAKILSPTIKIVDKKNKEYIVNRISCEKNYIVSPSKLEEGVASSVPIIISKPTATFELQTVVDFKLDVNEIVDICKKMSDSKLKFATINDFRNKSSFEKGLY